ncbi:MAG: hypothetical protein KatS3mg060_2876 [Dehalococcoidia bacterium]|nr:MAG: hypothetical protein KatS3mg060_2876 [Dehalococcoidia bacterium]
MLRAVVLRLRRRAGPPLDAARSYDLTHGWLSHRLADWEAATGRRLHGSGLASASPLLDPAGAAVLAGPGAKAGLRIALLDDALAEAWEQKIAPGIVGELVRLGRTLYEVEGIAANPSAHPMAESWTPRDVEAWSEDRPATPLRLGFITPTSFADVVVLPDGRRADRPVLVPDPVTVVQHLGRRWNALFPDRALPEGALTELAHITAVVRIDALRTVAVPFRGGAVVGFVGSVAFGCLSRDQGGWMLLAQLLRFGTLAGIGRKTAFGFGLATLFEEPTAVFTNRGDRT